MGAVEPVDLDLRDHRAAAGVDARPVARGHARSAPAVEEPLHLLAGSDLFRRPVHRSLPRAATGQVATTRPPRWTTTSSCRFVVPQAWLGRTVTTSPTSGRASHADRST